MISATGVQRPYVAMMEDPFTGIKEKVDDTIDKVNDVAKEAAPGFLRITSTSSAVASLPRQAIGASGKDDASGFKKPLPSSGSESLRPHYDYFHLGQYMAPGIYPHETFEHKEVDDL